MSISEAAKAPTRRLMGLYDKQSPQIGRTRAYARRLISQSTRFSKEVRPLLRWLPEYGGLIGLKIDDNFESDGSHQTRSNIISSATWSLIKKTIPTVKYVETVEFDDILSRTGALLGLDHLETAILQFVCDYMTNRMVEDLWDGICQVHGARGQLIADAEKLGLLLGETTAEIRKRLHSRALLRNSGILKIDPQGRLCVLERFVKVIREPDRAITDPMDALIGQTVKATLSLEAFKHLGNDLLRLRALIDGASKRGEHGICILLYGQPGTGKTELAKTLAASLNIPLRAIGEVDEHESEPMRGDRLSELCLAQKLAANLDRTLLLFDEAEDLLCMEGPSTIEEDSPGRSKVFIHRLLENTPLPVIFTANRISSFGTAVLRRMSCCLEVKVPHATKRVQLWHEAALAEGISVIPSELEALARLLPVPPGVANAAMRAASISGGDLETVKWTLAGMMRAMHQGQAPRVEDEIEEFDFSLTSADIDLESLCRRLSQPDATRRFSLLLSGPSGSGKSAFARHLAKRIGLPIMLRRASDLLDKYVGGTEKRIAAAFSEAADTGSFLIFDEADSLLADRRGAQRVWEVSQTNEMLTWMERHPLPFCCTTNFLDRIDEAAMRRFLVKVNFGFLASNQLRNAFLTVFQLEPPVCLAELDCVTPADLDLVRRRAEIEGKSNDVAALFECLRQEQAAKKSVTRKPIGFRLAS